MLGFLNVDEVYIAGFIAFAFICLAVSLAILCMPIIFAVYEGDCCTDDWSDDEDDDVEEEHMFN